VNPRLPTVLALSLALPAAACNMGFGDRAFWGECPGGETCSEATPHGLLFEGPGLSDALVPDWSRGPQITALAGTQTIRLRILQGDDEPELPFDLPFEARVESGHVEVIHADGDTLVVRGAATGEGRLRIVDPETGELYDRILLEAAPVAGIDHAVLDLAWLDGEGPPAWALVADGTAQVVPRLWTAGGRRIVDEGMAIEPADPAATPTHRAAWDEAQVTMELPVSGGLRIETTAGRVETIPVIGTHDPGEIVALDDDLVLAQGHVAIACFRAEAGGIPRAGLDWSFALSPNLEPFDLAPWGFARSCLGLHPAAPGPASITAIAGPVERTFNYDVAAGARAAGPLPLPAPPAPPRPGVPGERAARR
jgi:hypothetical protein